MPHAVYDTDLEDVRPAREPPVDHEVEEWSNKLKGKKLGETSDAKVRLGLAIAVLYLTSSIDICNVRPPTG